MIEWANSPCLTLYFYFRNISHLTRDDLIVYCFISWFQDYEQLIELLKQDAAESRQQIQTLTEVNTALSIKVYQLEAAQAAMYPVLAQPLVPPVEEKVDLTAFLLQATGEEGGANVGDSDSPQLDMEQFENNYDQYDRNDAPSPVLEVDEEF